MNNFAFHLACSVFALLLTSANSSLAEEGAVKVFILAGQSNMEGKAPNALFDHQATDPKTADFFAHLRDGDEWIERDDVFIKYLNRHGKLTLGYGSGGRTGPEYEFGYVLGEHFDEPVLLIKTAWGGHSLHTNFRPPSNPPTEEALQKELDRQIEQTENFNRRSRELIAEGKQREIKPLPTMDDIKAPYGKSYQNMIDEVKNVQANYETLFPELAGKKLELAGFFWFQGWNDQYQDRWLEYEDNFEALIKDVRKDLGKPNLPVVTGLMGQHGSKEIEADSPRAIINAAQLKMEAKFPGTVKAIETAPLVDQAAEELYPHWKDRFEEWKKTGGDHAYHYLGSAIWFTRIGRASGEAMIELIESN